MKVLGINAIFHDPAAALVVDGQVVAAAEEERFSRRKHGKRPVPFSAWELPELRAALVPARRPGSRPADLDAVAYSFDPALCATPRTTSASPTRGTTCAQDYARRAPQFLASALPGLDPDRVRFVPHHVAHAASAGLAAPPPSQRGAGAGRARRARHPPGRASTATGSWRCSRRSGCRTRSACSTRT